MSNSLLQFYSDGNCAKQFDDISVDACYNITGILEPLFPLVPYTGLDATCDSTGAVDGECCKYQIPRRIASVLTLLAVNLQVPSTGA